MVFKATRQIEVSEGVGINRADNHSKPLGIPHLEVTMTYKDYVASKLAWGVAVENKKKTHMRVAHPE